MKKPLYFEEFPAKFPVMDAQGGSNDHMYLHARCHPSSRTWASVHQSGFIRVICAECRKPIVELLLARKPTGELHIVDAPRGEP